MGDLFTAGEVKQGPTTHTAKPDRQVNRESVTNSVIVEGFREDGTTNTNRRRSPNTRSDDHKTIDAYFMCKLESLDN